ncbi:MAG TPA: YbaK/EbsC family protein [Chloroflexi bacterium]|nr:MAG: YbaK/EbsC family protein [Chloroflexota bacterium]HDD54821.1 YbaK/EbsC family protein [Chloroflexota bacterium]
MSKRNSSVERVKAVLENLDIPIQVQELPHSTRTAVEAAEAVKSSVGQIVKSLVFKTPAGQPVLILTSGSNQVDEKYAGNLLGEKISFADAEYVRTQTGFAIGGVSPYGLKKEIPIYIDRDLLQYKLVWAAAGSSHAVFSISPQDLVGTTQGEVISVHP